ncbi:pilus assembly protein TadG-related protein [Nocardioides limicola]|uniref:pilus assembly protein TadG-related protein n=1 Tax=Nocardioides limicola TaxID=2803368 RepID=UPI00193BEB65|nr:pilus assembly protein TadG-related protein [Nocardioides sp. DJM-14]
MSRGEQGQTTLFIVGVAVMVMMVAAVVVNASAAYLQRAGLDNLADGAALFAAESSSGTTGGVLPGGDEYLVIEAAAARAAVAAYLTDTGAGQQYDDLQMTVRVAGDRVLVRLSARLELPLGLPFAPEAPRVGADGSASLRLRQ